MLLESTPIDEKYLIEQAKELGVFTLLQTLHAEGDSESK